VPRSIDGRPPRADRHLPTRRHRYQIALLDIAGIKADPETMRIVSASRRWIRA
jgi:hypothetical protein